MSQVTCDALGRTVTRGREGLPADYVSVSPASAHSGHCIDVCENDGGYRSSICKALESSGPAGLVVVRKGQWSMQRPDDTCGVLPSDRRRITLNKGPGWVPSGGPLCKLGKLPWGLDREEET